MKPFSDQLRDAIEQSEKTRYRICIETGILQSTMSRFMRIECGLGVDAIDKVCECIGARLTVDGARKRTSKKRK